MPFAVQSSLDVVFWFTDRALNDGEYIQPQKAHRLMYLAQAYYAVAYPGKRLMPAVFVVDSIGPIEPTVYHALAFGRPPMIESNPLPGEVTHFLDSIWRRFGNQKADALSKRVAEHAPVAEAMAKGPGTEIPFETMVKYYAAEAAARRGGPAAAAPAVDQVVRPRMLRSQTGKAVAVTAWKPKGA